MNDATKTFDEVLAEYLMLCDSDPSTDVNDIAEKYPAHRAELMRYCRNQSSLYSVIKRAKVLSDDTIAKVADHRHFSALEQRQLGDYQILKGINRGGMGDVYRARQISLDREVAVKVISNRLLANEKSVERFKNESKLAGRLNHPNIVRVIDNGLEDDCLFFSMEFVQGFDLSVLAEGQGMDPLDAARIMIKVADAVHYAHGQGVIHRDLKPSNIVLNEKTHEPHIADFGLAWCLLTQPDLTMSSEAIGTPEYMAPEQVRGVRDEKSIDIHAIGATLYFLLTGQPPYMGRNPAHTMFQVANFPPKPPRQIDQLIPQDIETICLRCLELKPSDRYASAAEVQADLESFLAKRPIKARPIGRIEITRRWVLQNWATATLLAAVLLFLLASPFVALYANQLRLESERSARQLEVANSDLEKALEYTSSMLRSPDPMISGRDAKVLDVLDSAVAEAELELDNNPKVLGLVLASAGKTYDAFNDVEPSLTNLERANELLASVFGPSDRRTLVAQADWANALRRNAKTEEAIAKLSDAKQKWESSHDTNLDNYEHIVVNLVMALTDNGQFQEALELQKDSLQRLTARKGGTDIQTLDGRQHLGGLLFQLGKLQEAHDTITDVLADYEKIGESDSTACLMARIKLASVLRNLEKKDQSIEMLRTALEQSSRTLGEDHIDTLRLMKSLAMSLMYESGKHEEELGALLNRRYELAKSKFGDEHEITVVALSDVATRVPDMKEKIEKMGEAIVALETVLGPEHVQTLSICQQRAACLRSEGRLDEAIKELQRILPLVENLYGQDHNNAIATGTELAYSLADSNQLGKAGEILLDLKSRCERTWGIHHGKALVRWFNAVRFLHGAEKFEDAAHAGEKLLAAYEGKPNLTPGIDLELSGIIIDSITSLDNDSHCAQHVRKIESRLSETESNVHLNGFLKAILGKCASEPDEARVREGYELLHGHAEGVNPYLKWRLARVTHWAGEQVEPEEVAAESLSSQQVEN